MLKPSGGELTTKKFQLNTKNCWLSVKWKLMSQVRRTHDLFLVFRHAHSIAYLSHTAIEWCNKMKIQLITTTPRKPLPSHCTAALPCSKKSRNVLKIIKIGMYVNCEMHLTSWPVSISRFNYICMEGSFENVNTGWLELNYFLEQHWKRK